MRVAFLTHQWPDARIGGIGSYVCQSAAALVAAGHEAHVFTLSLDSTAAAPPPGVTLRQTADLAERVHCGEILPPLAAAIHAGGEAVYRLAIAWLLTADFLASHRQNPFDILEVPDVEALGLPLLLDPSRDLPIVAHLHCCTAIAHAANGVAPSQNENLIHALEFAALRLADGLCAPTESVVRATKDFCPLHGEVKIIPHPFTARCNTFTPPPTTGPILFIGRIEWLKGCGLLAETLDKFLPKNPTAHFRFIGPDTPTAPGGGSMRNEIQDKLNPQIADRVHFLGQLSQSQIDAELANCSFCVQPSLRENFSMAICQAMSAGRTAVVCNETGSVELLGDAGVVVDRSPANLAGQMHRLYNDRDRLLDLSERAFRRIRSFCSPISAAAQRVDFYKHTITDFRRRPLENVEVLSALSQMTGSLCGVVQSGSPGARVADICQRIADGKPALILLYGAGKHTARLFSQRHLWESLGHRVVGLIDDHPRFANSPRYLGLPVRALGEIERDARSGLPLPPIILSTDTYEDQFWNQTAPLRALGAAVFTLYKKAA